MYLFQVVVGSFLAGNQHEQKHKKQKNEFMSAAIPTAAVPISTADPIPNLSTSSSFRGENWSAMPADKPTDINVSMPGD